MKTETKVVTTTNKQLDTVDILQLLGLPEGARNIKVWVDVPGGGDWSNTSLDVDSGCPLHVSYEEVS